MAKIINSMTSFQLSRLPLAAPMTPLEVSRRDDTVSRHGRVVVAALMIRIERMARAAQETMSLLHFAMSKPPLIIGSGCSACSRDIEFLRVPPSDIRASLSCASNDADCASLQRGGATKSDMKDISRRHMMMRGVRALPRRFHLFLLPRCASFSSTSFLSLRQLLK